jgi:uncharacterized protein with HEPN domain
MLPDDRNAAYLWDMLDASKTIFSFINGISFLAYDKDRKLQLAVERGLEIIGEAARRVTEDFKAAHPDIPWKAMVSQRNVLAHEYGEIKQERIWLVAFEKIPALISSLEPLIKKTDP